MKVHSDASRLDYRSSGELRRSAPYEHEPRLAGCLTDVQGDLALRSGDVCGITGMGFVLDPHASVDGSELGDLHREIGVGSNRHDAFLEDVRHVLPGNSPGSDIEVLHGKHGLGSKHLPYQEREREDRDDREQPIAGVPAIERYPLHESSGPFAEVMKPSLDVVIRAMADFHEVFHINQQYRDSRSHTSREGRSS